MSDSEPARPVRISIIDDDDISRAGLVSLLGQDKRFVIVADLNHDDAENQLSDWADDTDVAIVDAADARRSDDHFPGAHIVAELRRRRTPGQTTVIVITGHFFNDAVRRRMREADADLFFHRSEIQDADRLREVVANPSSVAAPVPGPVDPEAQYRLGVVAATRVGDAVAHARSPIWVDEHGRTPSPRSRAWKRLRDNFNTIARLSPVNTDGRQPDRNQPTPSKPQIDRFLDWATRVRPTDQD